MPVLILFISICQQRKTRETLCKTRHSDVHTVARDWSTLRNHYNSIMLFEEINAHPFITLEMSLRRKKWQPKMPEQNNMKESLIRLSE